MKCFQNNVFSGKWRNFFSSLYRVTCLHHDDVIKWEHFPCCWPFWRGIHRWPVDSLTKASDAELWCFLWSAPEKKNGSSSNRDTGDVRCHGAHKNIILMWISYYIGTESPFVFVKVVISMNTKHGSLCFAIIISHLKFTPNFIEGVFYFKNIYRSNLRTKIVNFNIASSFNIQ